MPEYLAPGVYVEERAGKKTIEGVSTSTAGFVGKTERGPTKGLPILVTNFGEYQRAFGGFIPLSDESGGGEHGHLPLAVKQFFDNGGKRAFICRVFKHLDPANPDEDTRELELKRGVFARLRANAAIGMQKIGVTTLRGFDYNAVPAQLFGGTTPTTAVAVAKALGATREIDLGAPLAAAEGEHRALSSFLLLQAPQPNGPMLRAKEPGVWAEKLRVQVRPKYGPPVGLAAAIAGTSIPVASASSFYAGGVIEVRKVNTTTGEQLGVGYATVASILGNTLTVIAPTVALPGPAGANEAIFVYSAEVELSIEWGTTIEVFAGSWAQLTTGAPLNFTQAEVDKFHNQRAFWRRAQLDSKLVDVDMSAATAFDPADPLATHPTTTNGLPETLGPAAGTTFGALKPDADPDLPEYVGNPGADPGKRSGIAALEDEENISIVAVPGVASSGIQDALITHAERMKYRFAVLDGPRKADTPQIRSHRGNFDSKYAALYYPWIEIVDPVDGRRIQVPPSGPTIGIYARSDVERGVHKAPANEIVRGAQDVATKVGFGVQEVLNPEGINVIRDFRENKRGIRIWGARTISSDPEWKYVNVRRLFIYLEHSIDKGTQWVVFEPNNEQLWAAVKTTIETFLETVWRTGALLGTKPEEAYYVKCDRSTMSQDDLDNGRLICEIGVAPTKPAEFVIFRIGQFTADSQ